MELAQEIYLNKMKHIFIILMVFGLVGCSSEVQIECEYGSGKKYIVSEDKRTLTIIYPEGHHRIYQKEAIFKNGIIQFRHDARDFLRYDPLKKDFTNLAGKCKEV